MSNFELEMTTRITKALEKMVEDNREFIDSQREFSERFIKAAEEQARMARYYYEKDVDSDIQAETEKSLRDSYSEYVTQASARIAELEAQLAAPCYCCAECGSMGPFTGIVYPATPDGPEEYDMECEECGSRRIDESPTAVVKTLLEKIDDLEAQLAAVPKWVKVTGDPDDSPPENSGWVLSYNGSGCALTPSSTIRNYPGMYTHWMRITPPQVEIPASYAGLGYQAPEPDRPWDESDSPQSGPTPETPPRIESGHMFVYGSAHREEDGRIVMDDVVMSIGDAQGGRIHGQSVAIDVGTTPPKTKLEPTSPPVVDSDTLGYNASDRWMDAQGRNYQASEPVPLRAKWTDKTMHVETSGSTGYGLSPETPLHIRPDALSDPTWNTLADNTLLVTASALRNAGTTLAEFQAWIEMWWKLAVAPNLPFPKDEGESNAPTWEYP